MIVEIIYSITFVVVGVAVMIRWGLLSMFMLEFLGKKILDELSSLKVSARNLTSTFEGNYSPSN